MSRHQVFWKGKNSKGHSKSAPFVGALNLKPLQIFIERVNNNILRLLKQP